MLAEILNFQGTSPIWGMGSLSKLYLPSEEELLRELNQEYQALESSKTVGEDIGSEKEEGRY